MVKITVKKISKSIDIQKPKRSLPSKKSGVTNSTGPRRTTQKPRVYAVRRNSKTDRHPVETFFWTGRLSSLVLLLAAFFGGVYIMWRSPSSLAESENINIPTPAGTMQMDDVDNANLGPKAAGANMYNLTLSQLEDYLREGYKKTLAMEEEERIKKRAEALRQYLDSKKSPLSAIALDIARLKHWRTVLAISNSESSLGKRCADNNCSGIGVEPGHPLWREYESKADWARDLDKLIEKRYKDWTLEEMNGVYNQPGSKNWVLASRQVYEDLMEIE